jgi:putative membrane protein
MMPGFGWGGCCGFGAWGGYGWIINLAFSAVILIALVLLVIWAVRRITKHQPGSSYSSSQRHGLNTARDILQTRYANGEITREEYQQMLEDIR